jgi:hypothetical protein
MLDKRADLHAEEPNEPLPGSETSFDGDSEKDVQ